MRQVLHRTLGVLAILLCGAAHASVFDGTWQADMRTARLLASGPAQVIRLQDGQYACRTCDPPLIVRADGTDQPIAGAVNDDTVSIAVLDERTVIETWKRAGKTIVLHKFSVSDDGGSAVSEVSNYAASGAEVTSRQPWMRQRAGPPGSHAVSGSWVGGMPVLRYDLITLAFQAAGSTLAMRASSGASFAAPLNGDEVPYAGDPGIDTVSVRKISAHEIQETDKRAGKAVRTWRWSFDMDSRSGHVAWHDLATQATTQALLHRVE